MEEGTAVCASCGHTKAEVSHTEEKQEGKSKDISKANVIEVVDRNETSLTNGAQTSESRMIEIIDKQERTLGNDVFVWGIISLAAAILAVIMPGIMVVIGGLLGTILSGLCVLPALIVSIIFLSKKRQYKKTIGTTVGKAHVGDILGTVGFAISVVSTIITAVLTVLLFGIILVLLPFAILEALVGLLFPGFQLLVGAVVTILTSSVFIGLVIFIIQLIVDAASAVLLFL